MKHKKFKYFKKKTSKIDNNFWEREDKIASFVCGVLEQVTLGSTVI